MLNVAIVEMLPIANTNVANWRLGTGIGNISTFHEDVDAHALHDVKHALVLAAVGGGLLLLRVAVEVQEVHFVESLHQMPAHTPERRIV